jgi:uncharacterized protein (TIGR03067 family)
MILCACALLVVLLSPAPGRTDEASTKALGALQGTWTVVSLETEGKATSFPENPPRWVIKDNKVLYAGKELAVLSIDANTKPRSIDLAFQKPKRVYEGIYSLEDDTLKICVNRETEGVKQRPVGFATEGKPELRLLVFKRDKEAKADPTEGIAGFVGLQIMALQDRKAVRIAGLIEDSPAKKAGVKVDDVLLKVSGQEATDIQTVVGMLRRSRPGSEVTLRVERGGKEQDISVKVGVMPFYLLD